LTESIVPERTDHETPDDTQRAVAHLPGLDIAIEHRCSPSADAEMISIHLQAMPSFEAFGCYLEAANPFAFWAKAAQLAWQPWLTAARALTPLSGTSGKSLPKPPEG
jgi:hypothetical protein